MYPAKRPARRLLGGVRRESALLASAILSVVGGLWLSRLAPYIYYLQIIASVPPVRPRVISVLLFVIGASLGLLGASWAYPLIPPVLMMLLYVYGAPYSAVEALAANVIIATALMAALVFTKRYAETRSISISRGRPLWWGVAILLVLGAFAGSALLMRVIIEDGVRALLGSVASLPFTLREFYTVFSSTRVGLGIFTAVVVAVGVRVVTWIFSPIVEGLTASPQASLREVEDLARRELQSLVDSTPEISRWVSAGVSTALSLALLPAVGSLASFVESELSYLPGKYPRILGLSSSLTIYVLSWEILRRLSQKLSPTSISRDLKAHLKFRADNVGGDVLHGAVRVLTSRLLLGFTIALVFALALNYIMLALGGRVDVRVLVNVTLRGLAGGGEPYSALVSKYANAYSDYLSYYIENLERLFGIVIRLLWGG